MAKKDVKTNNKNKDSKNKKSFFKGFKAELKKVVWPTPKQLVNNTSAVITIVLITALIVFVLDLTFETINKNGVDKIKEVIETTQEDSNNTSEETNTQEGENTTEQNTESTDNTVENTNSDATEGTDSTETNTNNAENNIQE